MDFMKKILLSLILIGVFGTSSLYASLYPFGISEDSLSIENPNDFFQDNNFKISPNPSKDKLNITLPSSFENMTLEVFDVLGKRVHKSIITQLESSIDVSRWKTGVYLVKISNEKESQTKRFIKQ